MYVRSISSFLKIKVCMPHTRTLTSYFYLYNHLYYLGELVVLIAHNKYVDIFVNNFIFLRSLISNYFLSTCNRDYFLQI